MNLPRSLVLFLVAFGFGLPLVLGALALGAGSPVASASASAGASASGAPARDEALGTLTLHAFDLGFKPAMLEVKQPGLYTLAFVNDGRSRTTSRSMTGRSLRPIRGRPARARC